MQSGINDRNKTIKRLGLVFQIILITEYSTLFRL
jgi:hypothetical protein